MDNLEFAQWLKSYYDQNCDLLKIYDPVERRGNCEVDLSFADKGAKGNTHRVTLDMTKITVPNEKENFGEFGVKHRGPPARKNRFVGGVLGDRTLAYKNLAVGRRGVNGGGTNGTNGIFSKGS